MKRFQFSLDTLLALRREKEQECEIVLAGAAGDLARIDKKLVEARNLGDGAFRAPAGGLKEMQARENLWRKSVSDQKSLEAPRLETAKRVKDAQDQYSEAHGRRSALDRLREKRFEQWKARVKREEIRRLDETARTILLRNRRRGGTK